jgi:SAM-dependent methyltransferase
MIQTVKRYISDIFNRNRSNKEIFSKIYDNHQWGGEGQVSFYSGEGTYFKDVQIYIDTVTQFIRDNNIKTVCEIGCGDFKVTGEILKNVAVDYTGLDVVPTLVSHLNKNHQSENIRFSCVDASSTLGEIPKVDLCIIRQVLQHLNNENILNILENTKHIPNLLITEHLPINPGEMNGDKVTNGYIRLQNKIPSGVYLSHPPFSMKIKKELLTLRLDDKNHVGELIEAQIVTSWVVNGVS